MRGYLGQAPRDQCPGLACTRSGAAKRCLVICAVVCIMRQVVGSHDVVAADFELAPCVELPANAGGAQRRGGPASHLQGCMTVLSSAMHGGTGCRLIIHQYHM